MEDNKYAYIVFIDGTVMVEEVHKSGTSWYLKCAFNKYSFILIDNKIHSLEYYDTKGVARNKEDIPKVRTIVYEAKQAYYRDKIKELQTNIDKLEYIYNMPILIKPLPVIVQEVKIIPNHDML
jgi:hypothetical protein